ncbi:membrane dipeptidase [Patescibacteria group bacterium]|nr:membrane dipeptidase [Patescibacteria group bacterium]
MKNNRIQKIDTHIDIADIFKHFKYSQNDFYSKKDLPVSLEKLKEAGVKVLGVSLYFDKDFLKTSFYDGVTSFYYWCENLFSLSPAIKSIAEFSEIDEKSNDISCIYTIEGLQCFRSPDDFDYFYNLGVRIFGLSWEDDNDYACGRGSKKDKGISQKGFDVLERMNDKSLIIDIAHLSEKSVVDVAKNFNGMIVSTHGNVRSVHNSVHNLTDQEIQLIVDRGGVISLFPLSEDVGDKGSFDEFYNHIEYILNKWGEDCIAISSDIYPLKEYPFLGGHKDVLVLNGIEEYLLKRLDRKLVKKIFYDNWMRVFKQTG